MKQYKSYQAILCTGKCKPLLDIVVQKRRKELGQTTSIGKDIYAECKSKNYLIYTVLDHFVYYSGMGLSLQECEVE